MKQCTVALFLCLGLFLSGCGGNNPQPTPRPLAPTQPPTTEAITSSPLPEPDSAALTIERSGVADLASAERANFYKNRPSMIIDPTKTYRATIKTNKGDIVVSLDAANAPEHVNNFVYLSLDGFYDGLTFHRVEPGFVIQGGDPIGQGNGGPGYTVPGEFTLPHVEGAIAMARLPDQINPDRESSGSQFYITLAPTPFLDNQYSAFGVVESGMEVVKQIQIGDVIETITIE